MKVKPFIKQTKIQFAYRVTVHNTPEKVNRLYRHFTNFVFDYLYGDGAACIIDLKFHDVCEIKYEPDGLLTIVDFELSFNIINPLKSYRIIKALICLINKTLNVQTDAKSISLIRLKYKNHFIDNGGDFDSL